MACDNKKTKFQTWQSYSSQICPKIRGAHIQFKFCAITVQSMNDVEQLQFTLRPSTSCDDKNDQVPSLGIFFLILLICPKYHQCVCSHFAKLD